MYPCHLCSEFSGAESDAVFWSYVASVRKSVDSSSNVASVGNEEFALAAADELISKVQAKILRLSLASREFAPAVQVHYELAQSSSKQ